jgi:hypothetical protein
MIIWSLGMLFIVGLSPLVKLAAYEAGGAASIRELVGRPVVLDRPDDLPVVLARNTRTFRGTLSKVRYRLNDKWGFFDLYVEINGESSIATGLRPSDLSHLSVDVGGAR